jgi:hypothetical protein
MPNTKTTPTIDQLQCPGCGHKDSFRIEVSEFLLMFVDYKERCQEKDERWGIYSPCVCPDCRYQGAVLDFQPPELDKESAHG